jgi:hypothetical protein
MPDVARAHAPPRAGPLASLSAFNQALGNLRASPLPAIITAHTFGLPAPTARHVRQTFSALDLVDRHGVPTRTLLSLLRGETTVVDVLEAKFPRVMGLIRAGRPAEQVDAALAEIAPTSSASRTHAFVLAALARDDPGLNLEPYRSVVPRPSAPQITRGRYDREVDLVATTLKAQADLYLAAMKTALDDGDDAAVTRLEKRLTRLRAEVR